MEKFNSCLIVSRHELLKIQKQDIDSICDQVTTIPELPVNSRELQKAIESYDTIIGSFPVQIQIEILKNKKNLVTFIMRSLGTADNEEGAKKLASKYEGMTVILPPSKPGEKYRTLVYEGIKIVREIKVIDDWLIKHES